MRPKRFWYGSDISELTLVQSKSDRDLRVGDKVVLKNASELPRSTHGREGDVTGVISVQAFCVKETRTTVEVLWQDGIREKLQSTELIPYLNPDEYDCW